MREIQLDARSWLTVYDFYSALLLALGAPEEHGRNVNALVDSMIWGGMNKTEPPYIVRIFGVERMPKNIRDHIEVAKDALAEARAEFRTRRGYDAQVELEIVTFAS